jgi:hypothetical protein
MMFRYGDVIHSTDRYASELVLDRHDYTHSIELTTLHIHLNVYGLFCLFY